MRNTSQYKSSNTNKISGWDEAIARVEAELFKMERYVARLKAAKRVFLDSREQGLLWPGSVDAMMGKFDAGVAEAKKSPRRKTRAAA